MSMLIVVAVILALLSLGYRLGYGRSVAVAGGDPRRLHSRPAFYGAYVLVWAAIPPVLLAFAWIVIEPMVVDAAVLANLPEQVRQLSGGERGLVITNIANTLQQLEAGIAPPDATPDYVIAAAEQYQRLQQLGHAAMLTALVAATAAGLAIGWRQISPGLRARNRVESVAKALLIVCSTIAILTTIGIVLSMLFEALHFFSFVSPLDFFFGLTWDPRFSSTGAAVDVGQFGLLPVLWGTVFISAIAMIVAAPIGLMSAIYLSEYASKKVRSFAKPMLEVLAGIPTVVYGFFALSTVGPFFRDVGALLGLEVAASSALSAGFVMGVMIIPFVSSLSDDIINAVPQSLRDGAYALGATQSETVRQVIMPAALPGIVGALLLAVSRAIGETMIVVMAAGIAARLTVNPFEAVTTVTVKIVTQLTGDHDFSSPQTLVAFALGLTLFVITLCLNIVALHIVRKYREQYE